MEIDNRRYKLRAMLPGPQKLSKQARELKLKADEAFSAQKWKKALECYRELDQEIPNDARILQRIGDVRRRLNRNDEAVEAYRRVATLYADQGFWAKAIAVSKIALELDPTDLSIQRKLTAMHASQSVKGRVTGPVPDSEIVEGIPQTEAVSIAGAAPLTMETAASDAVLGSTVSFEQEEETMQPVSGAPFLETTEEVSDELSALGPPLAHLKGIPLFSDMTSDEFVAVLEKMAVRKYPAQTLVCEEGDLGRSMYIVTEGWLDVFTRDREGKEILLGRLRGGDFFGEFGLLTNGRRNASVRARTDVELLEITSADFDVVAGKHPRMWIILEAYLQRRMIHNILTKSEVFRCLDMEEREQLALFLKARKVAAGETVMLQGTDGDEMYFIKSGSVRITLEQGPRDRIVLGELSAGDYFGEVAMLTGKPRTATVRAKTDCELYELHRTDAARVLRRNRQILVLLRDRMNERAQDAIAAHRSYMEARTTLSFV